MRALITGGAGFIGSHIADVLIERGWHVMIVDDLSTGQFENINHLVAHERFHFAIETIENEPLMDRLVSECDMIFHFAAVVGVALVLKDPIRAMEANVMGTRIVLNLACRYRKKVMIASTSEIYGNGYSAAFAEDDPRVLGPITNSRWSYACSKSLDEFLGLAYYAQKQTPVVICRLFNTVGPRQSGAYGMVVPRLVRQALTAQSLTVFGDGQQTRCFCNIYDVVDAVLVLMETESATGQVFNVGATEEVTILFLAQEINALVGGSSAIELVPYADAYGRGFEDMTRRKPDISKIHRTCGWAPKYGLKETLEQILAYERAQLGH